MIVLEVIDYMTGIFVYKENQALQNCYSSLSGLHSSSALSSPGNSCCRVVRIVFILIFSLSLVPEDTERKW